METDLTQSPGLMESGGQPIIPTGQQPLTPSEAAPSAPQATNMPINQRPAPPQAQVQPTVQPKSTFHKALQALAGGPTRVQDPNTGEVKEIPETKASLSKHILAGAISGLFEGWKAGAAAPDGPLGTKGPGNAAAAAAGFQGSQNKLQQIRQAPQQQMDEQQARSYNTMKRNIDLHGAMLTLGNATRAAQDAIDEPGLALVRAADDYSSGDTSGVPLITDRGLSYDEIMKKYPDMSKNNFIPMGHRDMLNPDGSPALDSKTGVRMREPLFAVVNPDAKISLTPELKDMFGKMQPGLSKLSDNTPVNLRAFLSMQTQHINSVTAADAMTSAAKQIDAVTGSKTSEEDFQKSIQSDPVLRKNAAIIGQYLGHGSNVVEGMDALSKQAALGKLGPDGPALVGRLGKALGLDAVDKSGKTVKERLQLKYDAEKLKQKNDAEVEQRARDDQEKRRLHAQEVADTQDIKNRASDPYTSNTETFINQWTDSKGFYYDLSHPAMKLVDGTLAPEQLSKRATKGSDSYNNIIKAADDYSISRYGKPFDFQQAEKDSSYAKNTTTQNVLKMIDGMAEKGGAIEIAQEAAKALPKLNSELVNKVFNATATQFGSAEATNFHTAMLGLADEYSKVMGGGVSSDTGRSQALDILKASYSKGQLSGAVDIMKRDIAARKSAIIGNNRYLKNQYGIPDKMTAPPPGKFAAKDAKGNVIGYADDSKGTNFVRF